MTRPRDTDPAFPGLKLPSSVPSSRSSSSAGGELPGVRSTRAEMRELGIENGLAGLETVNARRAEEGRAPLTRADVERQVEGDLEEVVELYEANVRSGLEPAPLRTD